MSVGLQRRKRGSAPRAEDPASGGSNGVQLGDSNGGVFEATLSELLAVEEGELRAWVAANRARVGLPFLSWLADEEAVEGEEARRQRLWWLGSQLVVLTEGLDPASYQEVQEGLAAAAEAGDAGNGAMVMGGGGGSGGLDVVAARAASLAGLTPEGQAFVVQQLAELSQGMRAQRLASTAALIGRKQADAGDAGAVAAADAAARILDFLLTIPNRQERAAMLPDAFTPPPAARDEAQAGDRDGEDEGEGEEALDEEQLSTTPLRLLQAVDLYQSRLAEQPTPGAPPPAALLAGGGLQGEALAGALRELREDILRGWSADASGAEY